MIETPKRPSRLKSTRSLPRIDNEKNNSPKTPIPSIAKSAKQSSLLKSDRITYNTILNKLLSIEQPQKFMSHASRYINRSILECKEEFSALNEERGMAASLISDGIFIKKLAEMSEKSIDVASHFHSKVRFNKKILKEFLKSQKEDENDGAEQFEENMSFTNETEEERDHRLSGYSKAKEKELNPIKEVKIIYSEYIKSNKKSMDIYLKTKKQMEESAKSRKKNEEGSPKSAEFSHLKRVPFSNEASDLIEELSEDKWQTLSLIECEILKSFPNMTFIAHKSEKITVHPVIEELGTYCGYSVSKIAIEFSECHELFGEKKYRLDGSKNTVIEHAITIKTKEEKNSTGEILLEKNLNNLKIDKYVRVYLGE